MSNAKTASSDQAEHGNTVGENAVNNGPVAPSETPVVDPAISSAQEDIHERVRRIEAQAAAMHKDVAEMKTLLKQKGKKGKKRYQGDAGDGAEITKVLERIEDGQVKSAELIANNAAAMKEILARTEQHLSHLATSPSTTEKTQTAEQSPDTTKPSAWQRFKNGIRSFWRGDKKGGEKVGDGVAVAGNGVGGVFRETGHQIAEAVRGVDDVLRDTTKLVVGKGAGNVMKWGGYPGAGLWNLLTGKTWAGEKVEKKTFLHKAGIGLAWGMTGLAVWTNPGNLLWPGIVAVSKAMNALGKKFIAEANKPEGFKVTSRILGGVGAVGAYGAVGGGGTFVMGALGAGLLGRLYRWARGGTSSRKQERSSSQPPKTEEPPPESEVAAPSDMKKILEEMETARKEQEKTPDHTDEHGKEDHKPDDHPHSEQQLEQKEPKPIQAPAQNKPGEGIQGAHEESSHTKKEEKPKSDEAH